MKWEWSHLPFSLEDTVEQGGMDLLSLLRQHWVPAFPEPLPFIFIISPDNLPPYAGIPIQSTSLCLRFCGGHWERVFFCQERRGSLKML